MQEQNIYRLFKISVILKGLHAIIEIVGGVLLYYISTTMIVNLVANLTQETLRDDPSDLIAQYLLTSAQEFSVSAKSFAAFYLLSHGVIKIFLVAGLLQNKQWAYPSSLAVLGAFIVYQMYRYTHTHSLGLIVLTVFDLVVMWLIWHEYQRVRHHQSLTES